MAGARPSPFIGSLRQSLALALERDQLVIAAADARIEAETEHFAQFIAQQCVA